MNSPVLSAMKSTRNVLATARLRFHGAVTITTITFATEEQPGVR